MHIIGTLFGILGFLVLISLFLPSSRGDSSGTGGGCACDDDFGSLWGCFDSDGDGFCDDGD